MIEITKGNLLAADVEALVNTVNCVGLMGKGIALQFNFPTKRHWKGRSRIEDIRSGLAALVADVQRLGIGSIAVPPLGCGLGGLDWGVVRPPRRGERRSRGSDT